MSGANKMKRDELWMVQILKRSQFIISQGDKNSEHQHHIAEKENKAFRDNLARSSGCPSAETIIWLFYDSVSTDEVEADYGL
jgi:hypothetical protein